MTDLTLSPEPVRHEPAPGYRRDLSPAILSHERQLQTSREAVEAHRRRMDGAFLGFIGLDGATALIPGVNPAINLYSAITLTSAAIHARAGTGTVATGLGLVTVDILLGVFWGAGDLLDIFWRSSSFYGRMVSDRIDEKLIAIDETRRAGEVRGYLTEEEITNLENTLFRGGHSQRFTTARTIVLLGVVLLLLYSCVS